MKNFFWLSCLLLLPVSMQAQTLSPNKSIRVIPLVDAIELDGRLTEVTWNQAATADSFWQYFPVDSVQADYQTEIWMAYDDKNLYVAVRCYAPGRNYVTPSLRRDYRAGGNDNISLMFDTFNDKTNAFLFGINPYGVRREALISGGGGTLNGFSTSWDNRWDGEAYIEDDYWTAELVIPFKTLRFKDGSKVWRFNCYRFDTQSNERTTWVQIPRNQWIFNLAFMGDMIWQEPLAKTSTNVSLIPYISGGMDQDFAEGDGQMNPFWGVGGDAKIGITSGLNLDLTVNPDFSQVEVDRQQTNLSRFELFFPERRQFFLENADLFGDFGFGRMNPFFSRRIGVAQDTSTGQNIQNAIPFGLRLSGKPNQNWRVGLLNMQAAAIDEGGLPGYNYTVAAVQRQLFSRSNIGLIAVNKQAFRADTSESYNLHNRVLGLDYNLASADNRWVGKVFYHHSQTEGNGFDGGQHGAFLEYSVRNWRASWRHQWVDEDFNAEVGFVPRTGFIRINPAARAFFFPQKGPVNRHGPGVDYGQIWDPEIGVTDVRAELFWDVEFTNNSSARATVNYDYIYLFDAFDPTGLDSVQLAQDTDYRFWSTQLSFRTDRRRKLSMRLNPRAGQYFNGFRYGVNGSLDYRFQPYGALAINFNYDYIDLPEPFL
ncbi:MAG: DUF5916 domain-containing protein, partial [Bacteroidota bacterium]